MIERTLMSQVGVEKAVVALSTSRGHVEFDPTILGPRDVVQIVKVPNYTHFIAHGTLSTLLHLMPVSCYTTSSTFVCL